MRQSVPRLRSVRMKAGGADVRVIRPAHTDLSREMVRHANLISRFDGCISSFAVVAFYRDGGHSVGWHAGGNVGRSLLPALVHDVLLKDITQVAVEDEG